MDPEETGPHTIIDESPPVYEVTRPRYFGMTPHVLAGVLAARVKEAFRRLTGFEAKVGSAGLHVPLDDEVQLEELAEALERLSRP